MQIALVSLHTSPAAIPGSGDAGGMNVVVRQQALALHELGHAVRVITRATTTEPAGVRPLDPTLPHGPLLYALPAGEPALLKRELPSVLPAFAQALRSHPDLQHIDAVHSHYWLSGIAAQAWARSLGAVHVITLHTVASQKNLHLAPGDTPEPPERVQAEHELTTQLRVVAGSHSEAKAIRSGYGGDLPQVIHPGVDTQLFHPNLESTAALPAPESPLSITVLGRIQPLKGQDLAVQTLQELLRLAPGYAGLITLTVAGEPTPGAEGFLQSLREYVRDHDLPVQWLPAQTRTEAAHVFRESDLVLVPSHSETFGLVALEAAASGVPVVASDTTGLRESVQQGATGELVSSRDPKVWAATIAHLIADPLRRQQMADAARLFALRHSWQHHAFSLVNTYSSTP